MTFPPSQLTSLTLGKIVLDVRTWVDPVITFKIKVGLLSMLCVHDCFRKDRLGCNAEKRTVSQEQLTKNNLKSTLFKRKYSPSANIVLPHRGYQNALDSSVCISAEELVFYLLKCSIPQWQVGEMFRHQYDLRSHTVWRPLNHMLTSSTTKLQLLQKKLN